MDLGGRYRGGTPASRRHKTWILLESPAEATRLGVILILSNAAGRPRRGRRRRMVQACTRSADRRSRHPDRRAQPARIRRQWLLIKAGTSILAAVALGVATTRGVAAVFVVFGIWAAVSGAAQLV